MSATIEWQAEQTILDILGAVAGLSSLGKSRFATSEQMDCPCVTVSAERDEVVSPSRLELRNLSRMKITVSVHALVGQSSMADMDGWLRAVQEAMRRPQSGSVSNLSAWAHFTITDDINDERAIFDDRIVRSLVVGVMAALRQ